MTIAVFHCSGVAELNKQCMWCEGILNVIMTTSVLKHVLHEKAISIIKKSSSYMYHLRLKGTLIIFNILDKVLSS